MGIERTVRPPIGGQSVQFDQVISRLAGRQHRVVAKWQLVGSGVTRHAIEHRREKGWLRAVQRGVYVVGPGALSREGQYMAAVLRGGPAAVLSHQAAGAVLGIRPAHAGPIDVTVARRWRSPAGIRCHSCSLASDEVTVVHGIPVTTVVRTIFDLSGCLSRRQVESAMHEADVRRLTDRLSLLDLVERYPGRRGVGTVKSILAGRAIGKGVTRSELEERFMAFCDERGLPRPGVNVPLQLSDGSWIEVDCIWRDQRVIVELDGHASHATDKRFELDRARDRALSAAGWIPVRVTWRQLHLEADEVYADLAALLAARARRIGEQEALSKVA